MRCFRWTISISLVFLFPFFSGCSPHYCWSIYFVFYVFWYSWCIVQFKYVFSYFLFAIYYLPFLIFLFMISCFLLPTSYVLRPTYVFCSYSDFWCLMSMLFTYYLLLLASDLTCLSIYSQDVFMKELVRGAGNYLLRCRGYWSAGLLSAMLY